MSVEARPAAPAPDVVPPVPRALSFVTVKRNVALAGRSYGHWWVELDGSESYGWWPARAPLTTRDMLLGGPGVLNAMGTPAEGRPTRDPNHGLTPDYEFHPVLVVPRSDDEVRNAVRRFAATFGGEWRWSVRPTMNCRLFQLCLFDAVGLVDGTGNYHTRGSGCPALAPLRRLAGQVTGRRHWPTNLPAPGHRVATTLAAGARPPLSVRHPIRLGPS
ncbi:MAG: hypothetical protein ABR540_07215 [Acidimicrobiales bacterium]